MAYRKSYKRKYGRRKFGRRKYGARTSAVAKKALSIAKKVARIQRGDRSQHEVADVHGFYGDPPAAYWKNLSLTETGDGDGDRDGESAVGSFVKVRFRYYYASAPPTITSARTIRVVLLRQKYNALGTTTAPNATEIFDFTNLTGTQQTHLANYNKDNIDNFAVMYDKVLTIDPSDPSKFGTISFKYPYTMKFESFTTLSDYMYTNRLFLGIFPCGVHATEASDGPAVWEYKSDFVFYR